MVCFAPRCKTEPPAYASTLPSAAGGKKSFSFPFSKKENLLILFRGKEFGSPQRRLKIPSAGSKPCLTAQLASPRGILAAELLFPARVRCVAVSALRNLDFPERSGGKKIQILARTEQRHFLVLFGDKKYIPMRQHWKWPSRKKRGTLRSLVLPLAVT